MTPRLSWALVTLLSKTVDDRRLQLDGSVSKTTCIQIDFELISPCFLLPELRARSNAAKEHEQISSLQKKSWKQCFHGAELLTRK